MKKLISIVMTALIFVSGFATSVFAEPAMKQKRGGKIQKAGNAEKQMQQRSGKFDQLETSADEGKLKKQAKNIKFDDLETKDWKR